MSSIDFINASAAGNQPGEVLSRIPKQTLGQEDFLQLLVTQMTTQDPLNPKMDTDFVAQMATFSSLEQAKLMQTDLASMRLDQQVLQANSLIGRDVIVEGDETKEGGRVAAVLMVEGTPRILVNGAFYRLDQVLQITPQTENNKIL